MPIEILKDTKLFVDNRDFTGVLGAMILSHSAETREARVFGDSGIRRLSSLADIAMSHSGFVESATVDLDTFNIIGKENVPVTVCPNDAAEGKLAFIFRAVHSLYSLGGAIGDMHAFNVTAEGGGGDKLVRGTVLHNGVQTVSGTGTAFQVGAVGASQKLYASLHVLAASVSDTLDVTIESDALVGFGTPTTRVTFAQKTAVGSEWAVPIPGAITDDFWRVAFTIGGASPSFTFLVTIGIQ